MTGTPIYDALTARPSDPATSHAAGAKANRIDSQTYVIHLLAWYGPSTDEELFGAFLEERAHFPERVRPWKDSRLRTARNELVEAGTAVKTVMTRRTSSGREAIVWGLSETTLNAIKEAA